METVLIFICLFLVFLVWVIICIFKSPKRIKKTLIFGGIIAFVLLVYNVFLVDHHMNFIQSNVYPHLYLIENEINDRDSLNRLIKQMVVQKMNSEFIGNEYKYKSKNQYSSELPSRTDISYNIDFFQFYKGWGTDPFGEAGTAHFIDHEEDPGGFSSEELNHYEKYRIADFSISFCENDTVHYYGIISYYYNGENTKTDTLINNCIKNHK